jgi:WhiB family transcriptional regulator, redox-sensing transcriptional regulator
MAVHQLPRTHLARNGTRMLSPDAGLLRGRRPHWIRRFRGFRGGKSLFMLSQAIASSDWRARSACLDEDPELFFPIGMTGPAVHQVDEAKLVCSRCTVREACLAWALDERQEHGVWGGLDEDERRALRRRGTRKLAGAVA